jgi:hypothetical protein
MLLPAACEAPAVIWPIGGGDGTLGGPLVPWEPPQATTTSDRSETREEADFRELGMARMLGRRGPRGEGFVRTGREAVRDLSARSILL